MCFPYREKTATNSEHFCPDKSQQFSFFKPIYNLESGECFFCSAQGVGKQWKEFKESLNSLKKFNGIESIPRRWDVYTEN